MGINVDNTYIMFGGSILIAGLAFWAATPQKVEHRKAAALQQEVVSAPAKDTARIYDEVWVYSETWPSIDAENHVAIAEHRTDADERAMCDVDMLDAGPTRDAVAMASRIEAATIVDAKSRLDAENRVAADDGRASRDRAEDVSERIDAQADQEAVEVVSIEDAGAERIAATPPWSAAAPTLRPNRVGIDEDLIALVVPTLSSSIEQRNAACARQIERCGHLFGGLFATLLRPEVGDR